MAIIKRVLLLILLQANFQVWALDLLTPRGALIQVDVFNPGLPRVLLLAPGQGCSPRADLYGALAKEAGLKGFTLVRLYWAYCVADPAKGNPSQNYRDEKEDLQTALRYVRQDLGFADAQILIGGKSLGSFISHDVFVRESSLPGLVLLTPVCSNQSNVNVFAQNYPGLGAETRTVLLVQGRLDPLCETRHFQEFVKNKPANFASLVTDGDHSLKVPKAGGQNGGAGEVEYDPQLSERNLQFVSEWVFARLK